MVIDGKKIALGIYEDLKQRVSRLPIKPLLCDVVIGNDPVTMSFVRAKQKWSEYIGIEFQVVSLPADVTQAQAEEAVKVAQDNPRLCGLIVQLPLPQSLDKQKLLNCVREELDVDCLSEASQQKFYQGGHKLVPPTAGAVFQILFGLQLNLSQEKILLVGRGGLVGKPVARLLELSGLKFEIADSTTDLSEVLQKASVVISGVGKAGLIKNEMLADQAVVIDAGTSESEGSIRGDVEADIESNRFRFITPVPGGVGPVTVARLLVNVVEVAEGRVAQS